MSQGSCKKWNENKLSNAEMILSFKAGILHIANRCNRAPEERVTNGDVALFCEMEADELEDDEILDIILGVA